MKNLMILGAGTAGTMMSHHLLRKLNSKEWNIQIVDKSETHFYQPGYLFLPFDIYQPNHVKKPLAKFIPKGVTLIKKGVEVIIPDQNEVKFEDGTSSNYDVLVIATGAHIAPDEIEGLLGDGWQHDIFDFYTYQGAENLRQKLKNWKGGEMVVHIAEMPIKCPVAPLEFAFLADSFFRKKGMRDEVKITFVTPMSGAFTKPVATKKLSYLLEKKNIHIVSDFNIESVDNAQKKIIDYGEKEVGYDLLVTVPTNMGSKAIENSGFGDELNFVPTDKSTLQSKVKENIFVIGDATNIPASKAGSVAHFEAGFLTDNILSYIKGESLEARFDGHSNCFVETGGGKALLIDFNYTHEPVPGTFPLPGVGPLRLLEENRINHYSKLAFRWVYWNMLIKGKHIPFIPAKMNEAGKKFN